MGADVTVLEQTVRRAIQCVPLTDQNHFLLVTPLSTKELTPYLTSHTNNLFHVTQAASIDTHLNLDDLDFPGDGIVATITRVVGKRGLGVFHIHRHC